MTLVDAKFLKDHINEVRPEGTVNEAVQQVAFADKILLIADDGSRAASFSPLTRLRTYPKTPIRLKTKYANARCSPARWF